MTSCKSGKQLVLFTACLLVSCAISVSSASTAAESVSLWQVYETALKSAKYVDLTHTITPAIPVWIGFAASTFSPAKAGTDLEGFAKNGEVYTYQKHGFEATEYTLRTDQLGTQLDPPVHWASEYARGSYAVRPLGFKVADTAAWEEARPSSSRAPTGQGPA